VTRIEKSEKLMRWEVTQERNSEKHKMSEQREALKAPLPTNQELAERLKSRLWQGLSKGISKLKGCVNLLDDDASILDGISKVVPLDSDMFCTRTKLIGPVDELKASSIVFINGRLVHSSIHTRLAADERKILNACEIKTFGKFR
jgi:hypothetical protein